MDRELTTQLRKINRLSTSLHKKMDKVNEEISCLYDLKHGLDMEMMYMFDLLKKRK
jgi:hypothetical protein